MLSEFHTCVSCGVERLASTLDEHEQCPFCIEEGTPLPKKYAEVVVVPSKNAGPRSPTPIPQPQRAQTPLEEAYTLPYAPPAFDQHAAEADPARELATRELCRRRLLPFIQRFRPKYLAGWVHEDICRRLERFVRDVELGKEPRLLLMMPPRSGKSEIGSRHFPAWVLGRHPDWELIAASHTSALTLSFSRYLRDLVRDHAYSALFPDMRPDPSSQSIENWSTLSGGGYLAAGVGTGITGRGCFSCNTLVQSLTQSDRIPISTIRVGESVYGYDHRTGCVKEVKVLAVSLSRTRRNLVAVEDIVCTDDHPFHNPVERSYTSAGALSTNMSLLRRTEGQNVENVSCVLFPESANAFDRKNLSSLQGKEDWASIRVQKLPHGAFTARPNRAFEMYTLFESIREEDSRARIGNQEIWGTEHVLFARMLSRTSETSVEDQGILRRVWSAIETCGSEEVLYPELLFENTQKHLDEGDIQPELFQSEKNVALAKRSNLRDVRAEDVPSGGASHRSRCGAQQSGEFGAVVRSMSQVVSHTRGVCAGDLEAFIQDEDGELVVDIQTESSNFFVGAVDLLVHNCHILLLDDLVKDMEAADSPTIKENCWEWYISTAYTRLAPGGGVLGIMCMTGDTLVLMADGTQRRLDTLIPSDNIATYDRGRLGTSIVKDFKSNGRDSILKITTTSGKIVRANQRHPFLTMTPTGELVWTRARSLTTAHKIVTVKDSGESGAELLVQPTGVSSLPNAEVFASPIMPRSNGQTAIVRQQTRQLPDEMLDSNIVTESLPLSTTICTSAREDVASFAKNQQQPQVLQAIGKTNSLSTIVTIPERYEDCCATIATLESDTLELSLWHLPQPGTSDFTLEQIASVEFDGIEEVFDVQVERTENFIANGVVSHNTWWSEDDWAGRIQNVMASSEGDVFEIVKYPAINEEGDEYLLPDDSIQQFGPLSTPPPEGSRLTRPQGTALHPERYSTTAMLKKKANYIAAGLMRVWNALYQQNPTPDDGVFFTREMLRYYTHEPQRRNLYVYQAWDFAITEKQQSDWTACVTIGQDQNNNLHIMDVLRFKSGDGNAIIETVLDHWLRFKPDLLGFEDGQIWKSLTSQFRLRCEERSIYPSFNVLPPLTDKLVRAGPLRGRMQLGKVYIKQHQPWTEVFVRELMMFNSGGKHDDMCFVAGTSILMADESSKPIEEVKIGDFVSTPLGPRMVIDAGCSSNRAKVFEFDGLVGTGGHPVWTHTRGWVRLDSLTDSDRLQYSSSQEYWESSYLESTQRQSSRNVLSSTGRSTGDIRTHQGRICKGISLAPVAFCIAIFGCISTALSRLVTKFITSTTTISTTTSQILSVFPRKCTASNTQKVEAHTVDQQNNWNISTIFGSKLPSGTGAQKAWLGMCRMESKPGLIEPKLNANVVNAAWCTSLSYPQGSFVRRFAGTNIGIKHIRGTTRSREKEGRHAVFNLTVADAHCYYANGILVHNCDAASWCVRLTLEKAAPRIEQPKKIKSWKDRLKNGEFSDISHMSA